MHSAQATSVSLLDTQSIVLFVSIVGGKRRVTIRVLSRPTKLCESDPENPEAVSSKSPKTKAEKFGFHKLLIGSVCSNGFQKRHHSATNQLKQQQIKLEFESRLIRIHMEQYQISFIFSKYIVEICLVKKLG